MLTVNYGTKAAYTTIASKSEDALYFCTDTRELFKGSALYTEPVRFLSGSDLPAAKAQGVLVVLTKFCDPEEFDYPLIKRACAEAEIPCVLIEVDRQMVNYEQARTAIETFKDLL